MRLRRRRRCRWLFSPPSSKLRGKDKGKHYQFRLEMPGLINLAIYILSYKQLFVLNREERLSRVELGT